MTIYVPVSILEYQHNKNMLRHGLKFWHGLAGARSMKIGEPAKQAVDMAVYLQAVAAHQDIEAYERVFQFYAPRVKAYMMKLAADNQLAEELMQETMIAVWNKAARFDPAKGAVSTWIFTIARNLRIDAVRRAKRPQFDPDDPAFVPDAVPLADEEMVGRQASDALHKAIATLPEEQSQLLKLSFFEDYSQSAIATELNIPLGTVKSRMRLAFTRLRNVLQKPTPKLSPKLQQQQENNSGGRSS